MATVKVGRELVPVRQEVNDHPTLGQVIWTYNIDPTALPPEVSVEGVKALVSNAIEERMKTALTPSEVADVQRDVCQQYHHHGHRAYWITSLGYTFPKRTNVVQRVPGGALVLTCNPDADKLTDAQRTYFLAQVRTFRGGDDPEIILAGMQEHTINDAPLFPEGTLVSLRFYPEPNPLS